MTKLTYEQIIQRDGKYVFSPTGTSMLPLLRQKYDTVLVEKPPLLLKKHDVALYKRQSGEYVLHRVMKVQDGSYVFCGDNQTKFEYGITNQNVIAVMTGFWRGEKFVSTTNKRYLTYTKIWCASKTLRTVCLFLWRIFNSLKRRIKVK